MGQSTLILNKHLKLIPSLEEWGQSWQWLLGHTTCSVALSAQALPAHVQPLRHFSAAPCLKILWKVQASWSYSFILLLTAVTIRNALMVESEHFPVNKANNGVAIWLENFLV